MDENTIDNFEELIKLRDLKNPELIKTFKNENYFILYDKIFIPHRKIKDKNEQFFINNNISSDNMIVRKPSNEKNITPFSFNYECFCKFSKAYNVDIFYSVDDNRFCIPTEIGLKNLNVSKLRKYYAQELVFFTKINEALITQLKKQQLKTDIIKTELRSALINTAEELVDIEFNRDNFNILFPQGLIQTPIEPVKLGDNQFEKLKNKHREKYLDLVYKTLHNPSIIINEFRLNNGNEELSHNYIKSYKDDSVIEGFQSIIVTIDNKSISVSSHNRSLEILLNKIKTPEQLNFINPEVGHLIEQHTLKTEQGMVNPTRNLFLAIESAYSTDITRVSNSNYNKNLDLSTQFLKEPSLPNSNLSPASSVTFQEEDVTKIINKSLEMENGKITEKGWNDISKTIQMYSDKRYETARYLFVKDGKIIRHVAVSNQNPSSTISQPDKDFLFQLRTYAEKTDSSVVFVHNHPSGYVAPSDADIETTKYIKNFFNINNESHFAGHIILDHGTFGLYESSKDEWLALINDKYYPMERGMDFFTIHSSELKIPQIKRNYENLFHLSNYAKEIDKNGMWNREEHIPAFFATHNGIIRSLEYIQNDELLPKNYNSLKSHIKYIGREVGSNHIYFVPQTYQQKMLCEAFAQQSGIVQNIYFEKNDGSFELSNWSGGDIFNSITEDEIKRDDSLNYKIESTIEGSVEKTQNIDKENNTMENQSKNSNERAEYDEKGNYREYDSNGKEIHFKDSYGIEYWREYDEKGNNIHFKNSYGYEEWKEYDEKGNNIHYKNSDGDEYWNEYDNKGNLIHFKNFNGKEEWKEYDEKGNVIHFKNSNGFETWKEYDDKGNEIHYKNSNGFERWNEYDDKGNEIHSRTSDDDEPVVGVDDLVQNSNEQDINDEPEPEINIFDNETSINEDLNIFNDDYESLEEWKEYDENLGIFTDDYESFDNEPSFIDSLKIFNDNSKSLEKSETTHELEIESFENDSLIDNTIPLNNKQVVKDLSKVIVIDTETTGFKAGEDELLQVSIIDGNGKVLFDKYIKPDHKTEWKSAMYVNHISPKKVENAPSIQDLVPEIQEIINNADLLISYNGRFDMNFLEAVGISAENKPHLDVLKPAASITKFPPKSTNDKRVIDGYHYPKLTDVAEVIGFSYKAHNSLGDTTATLEVAKTIYGNNLEKLTSEDLIKYSIDEKKISNLSIKKDNKEFMKEIEISEDKFHSNIGNYVIENHSEILDEIKQNPDNYLIKGLLDRLEKNPDGKNFKTILRTCIGEVVENSYPNLVKEYESSLDKKLSIKRNSTSSQDNNISEIQNQSDFEKENIELMSNVSSSNIQNSVTDKSVEDKINELTNSIENLKNQLSMLLEQNNILKKEKSDLTKKIEILEGKQNNVSVENNVSEPGNESLYVTEDKDNANISFNHNTAYNVNQSVPKFGHYFDDGRLQIIDNAHFKQRELNKEDSSKNIIVLEYADKDGNVSELKLEEKKYVELINAQVELEQDKQKYQEGSIEWKLIHEKYDKRMNINHNVLRSNFASNFRHNFRILCRLHADSYEDAYKLAKDLYKKMHQNEKNAFNKNYIAPIGEKNFDNWLKNEFEEAVKDIDNRQNQFLKNNQVLYEINNDYFQLAQGAFVGKTSNKVGEELELSFLERNTFTGRKTISPKEKWTIVKVTKNMDPDTVLLFNKDKKVSKTMSLKSFEKNMQRIEKIQRKEERKELKKNEKFACRGE